MSMANNTRGRSRSSIVKYSYHLSAHSMRTVFAVLRGFAASSKWPKRNPPQSVRADQPCTHLMREFCESCGSRRRSSMEKLRDFSTSPLTCSRYVAGSIGATGLYHIRRKLYSSAWSLGSSNFVSPRNAAAAADARNNRRFIAKALMSFYSAGGRQPLMQPALLGGLVGLAETIVDARKVIMNIRHARVDSSAALQLHGGVGIFALLF